MMSMKRTPILAPFLATLLAAACAEPDTASHTGDLSTTFDTVGGVIHVGRP